MDKDKAGKAGGEYGGTHRYDSNNNGIRTVECKR